MNESLPSLSDLLQTIPGPNPSGEDTRYTRIYDRIKEARRADPDLPQGDWRKARKIADWSTVAQLCTHALRNETKDLQIAAWLTEALVHETGFPGLTFGLKLLQGLVDDFWPTVYPRSEDKEDELEFRAGPLEWVGSRLEHTVKSVPLNSSGADWYEVTLEQRNVGTANAVVNLRGDGRDLGSRVQELDACLTALAELDRSCETQFEDMAPRLDGLRTALKTIKATIEPLTAREVASPDPIDTVWPELPVAGMSVDSAVPLELVHFTVTAPGVIEPSRVVLLTLWVHLESQRAAVIDRALQQHRARDLSGVMTVSKGPVRVARGTTITVRLEVPSAHIEDPEDSVLWDGDVGCANFLLTVPAGLDNQSLPGQALIYLSGVRVAKVQFVLQVGVAPVDGILPTTETRVQKAFASYASADRDEVLGRLQGIKKAAPDLDVFFDVLNLRSGDKWQTEIERMIPASDVFYLFWSLNASTSAWVEREWRTALRTGREGFIDPVPLQPPEEAPPPPELASLHFNDWMLAFQRRKHSLNSFDYLGLGGPKTDAAVE